MKLRIFLSIGARAGGASLWICHCLHSGLASVVWIYPVIGGGGGGATSNMSKSATNQDNISHDWKEHGINIKCDNLSMFHDMCIRTGRADVNHVTTGRTLLTFEVSCFGVILQIR